MSAVKYGVPGIPEFPSCDPMSGEGGSVDATLAILIAAAVIVLLMVINFMCSLQVAQKDIFRGSGAPISMAQTLLSLMHFAAQHFLAVLIIVILGILISTKIIESQAGLPILSAVAGYCLGKSFKDVGITVSRKGNDQDGPEDSQ
jgi:hypothetical protein